MAYTDWRWRIALAVAMTACGFDSGGDGVDSTGGTSSTGSTDPSTTDPSTTTPTTTMPSTTGPATTEPTTTDATSTDPTTTDPSTDPTTTDPSTDPTTTDPTTGDETTETDPSQGSTGGDRGVYGPCDGNTCPDDQMCAVAQNENETVVGNSCRPTCDDPGDCPVPATGTAQIFCPSPQYPFCVLECANSMCPDGMECYPTEFGEHCHWPL